MAKDMLCSDCYGRGWRMGDASGYCPTCHGSGFVYCCEGENVNMAARKAKRTSPARSKAAKKKKK